MSVYSQALKVTAAGSDTIRIQRANSYTDGPSVQIVWLQVSDPDDFVRDFDVNRRPGGGGGSATITLDSTVDDLVIGWVSSDNTWPGGAPAGTTQEGTSAVNNFCLIATFSVDSPGATSSTITDPNSSFWSNVHGYSLKGGVTWQDVTVGTGGTTSNYTTQTLVLADSGTQYRLRATNTSGTVYSNAATLTVTAGGGTTFTITPSGSIAFSGTVVPGKGKAFQVGGTVALSGTVALLKAKTQVPSGTVTFSGGASLSLQKNITLVPSGSIVFAGTAPITFSNGSTTFIINPSGSVTFSGTVLQNHNKVFTASGAISFAGTVQGLLSRVMTPSGQIVFSGTIPFVHTKLLVPSGTIVFSGTAPISFNGGTPSTTITTRLPLTFAGTT